MRKNEEGSTLVWAIVVVTVLSISVAAAFSISYAYYHRAISTNNQRQAYLTAKGVIEDIVDRVLAGDDNYIALFDGLKEDEKTFLTINVDKNLGDIKTSSYIERTVSTDYIKEITIGITASFLEQEYTVKADMVLGLVGGLEKWQLDRYYQGENEIELTGNIKTASELSKEFSKIYSLFLEKGMKAVNEFMQNDPGWRNIPTDIQATILSKTYFDDETIRKFFCYRNADKQFAEFNKDEIKKTSLKVPYAVSKTVNGVIETEVVTKDFDLNKNVNLSDFNMKTEFFHNTYYIQPKYANKNKAIQFIFAGYNAPTVSNGGTINLFYSEGSWYFIGKMSLGPNLEASFMGPTTFDNITSKQWTYFKANYLTDGNKVQ